MCTDLRYHSTDVLGVDEFSSRNKQTLTLHLLKVLLILDLQGRGDIRVCVLLHVSLYTACMLNFCCTSASSSGGMLC